MATRYYVFPDDELVKVVDRIRSFAFRNGKWESSDHYWRVTGMSGDCDFQEVTQDQAKRQFPRAFRSAPVYDPSKWENDPHLTAEDLKTTDETFANWREMRLDPSDVKNLDDRKKYRAWLEKHRKK